MNPWEKTENFDGDVKVYYDNLLNHFISHGYNIEKQTLEDTHLKYLKTNIIFKVIY